MAKRVRTRGLGAHRRRYAGLGYSDKPPPGDPWVAGPEGDWPPPPPDNPNAIQDLMLRSWMDWMIHGRSGVARQLNVLPPQEQQQWRLNNLKQLEEMFNRFQFGPKRTSR